MYAFSPEQHHLPEMVFADVKITHNNNQRKGGMKTEKKLSNCYKANVKYYRSQRREQRQHFTTLRGYWLRN